MYYLKTKNHPPKPLEEDLCALIEEAADIHAAKQKAEELLKTIEEELFDRLPQSVESIVDAQNMPLLKFVTFPRLSIRQPQLLKSLFKDRFDDFVEQTVHYRCKDPLRQVVLEGYDKDAQTCRAAVQTTIVTSVRYVGIPQDNYAAIAEDQTPVAGDGRHVA